MAVAGIDPAFKNLATGFYWTVDNSWDITKVDLLQQENPKTGKIEEIEYEEKHAVAYAQYYVDGLWDNFFSRVKYVGIEKQLSTVGKRQRQAKQPFKHVLFSTLVYQYLSQKGIEVFFISPRKVRAYYHTSVKGTGDQSKDYKTRKQKSVEKFKELVPPDFFLAAQQKFGKKMDDVADAFLLTNYVKENLHELIQEKKEASWSFVKSTGKTKKKLKKRFMKISYPLVKRQRIEVESPAPERSSIKRQRTEEVLETKRQKI